MTRGRPFCMSANKRAEVVAAYRKGSTSIELAAVYGVTYLTVLRWAKAEGVTIRHAGPSKGKLGFKKARLQALLEACRAHRRDLPDAVDRALAGYELACGPARRPE